MKVICSSVSTGAFRCNITTPLAFSVSESRSLIRESPMCTRSANTFAKRSLDGIRSTTFAFTSSIDCLVSLVRRRILVQAETSTTIATSSEVSPPLPVEAESAKDSLSVVPDASAPPLESAKEAENITSGVLQGDDLRSDLSSNISPLVDSAKQFSTDATEKVTKSLTEASSLVKDKVEDLSNTLQSASDTIAAEVARKVDEANNAVGSAISSTEEAYTQLLKQLIDSIPPEYKEYVDVVKTYASSTIEFASANRVPLLIGSVAIFGYASFAFYKYRFQGYSGDILPEKVLGILQTDVPALLVDVRSEKSQQNAGIPKLRRKAIGKAVPLPLCTPTTKPIRTLTSSSRETRIAMTAAYISGLTQATEATSFVILAENDRDGRDVARALERNEARNAFVMLGGFEAWTNSGLLVGNVKEYDVTPIDAISEKAQDIVEPLKDPKLLAVAAVALTATGWSVWNYRYILRLLGVLGPTLTLLAYLIRKYDALDDFVEDIGTFIETLGFGSISSETDTRAQTANDRMEATGEVTETTSEEVIETTPEINETKLAES